MTGKNGDGWVLIIYFVIESIWGTVKFSFIPNVTKG